MCKVYTCMYSTHQCVQYIPLCIILTSWYSSYLCLQFKFVCTVHTSVYIKYQCKRQLFCKLKIVYKQQVLCIMYKTALFVSNITTNILPMTITMKLVSHWLKRVTKSLSLPTSLWIKLSGGPPMLWRMLPVRNTERRCCKVCNKY